MAASKYTEEQRLEVIARINSGEDLYSIVTSVGVAYPTVTKWKRDMEAAVDTDTVHSLVDVDTLMIHRIADEVKAEMSSVLPKESKEICRAVDGVIEKIDSYQLLSTKLHDAATKLVDKISAMSDDELNLGPVGLQILVESLSRIQVAFFNKNSTNVNILNNTVVSEKKVDTFKAFQKN